MQNTNNEKTRWRSLTVNKRANKLKPYEIGALKTLAIQLVAEMRGDDIPLSEVTARTPIKPERLVQLIRGGQFPSAYFTEGDNGDDWFFPISDLQC